MIEKINTYKYKKTYGESSSPYAKWDKVKLPSVGFSSAPTEIEELRLRTPRPVATPE